MLGTTYLMFLFLLALLSTDFYIVTAVSAMSYLNDVCALNLAVSHKNVVYINTFINAATETVYSNGGHTQILCLQILCTCKVNFNIVN